MPKQKEPYIDPEPTATKSQPSIFSRIKDWFKEKYEAIKEAFSSLNKPGGLFDRVDAWASVQKPYTPTDKEKKEEAEDKSQAAKRFEVYQKMAKKGDIDACMRLGDCYTYGAIKTDKGFIEIDNLKKDSYFAFKCYEQAYSLSKGKEGSVQLGKCYEYGFGTKVDLDKAEKCYSSNEKELKGFYERNLRAITESKNFTIPDGITNIKYATFENCKNLESIIIPDGVKYIDFAAFGNCTNLKSVTIPDSIVQIEDGAFIGCENLTEINYTGTKEQWTEFVKNNPHFLLENTRINFINEKEHSNFEFSDKNADVKGTKVADYIAGKDFIMYTSNQDQNFKINENGVLTKYDGMANSIISPEHITEIGKNAFAQNENITDFITFNNVKRIGDCAFENCKNLETIIISKGVESIGGSAFDGCENLKDVYYTGTRQQWEELMKNSPNCGLEGKEIIFINEKEHNDFEFSAGSDEDQWGPSLKDVTETVETTEDNLSNNEYDIERSDDECL